MISLDLKIKKSKIEIDIQNFHINGTIKPCSVQSFELEKILFL